MEKNSPALQRLQPDLRQAVLRLHSWEQRRRWLIISLFWLVLLPLCLAMLRYHLGLLFEYFTWSGLRYGLAFNPIPAAGIMATVLLTLSSLLSQWFYRHYGLTAPEVYRLEKRARRIRAKGERYPLWWKVWG